MPRKLLCFAIVLLPFATLGQDSTSQVLPANYLQQVSKRVEGLFSGIDKTTEKYFKKFKKTEVKLLHKLAKKDSLKAAQLQAQSQAQYQQLNQILKGEASLQEYIPSLDTLITSLKFLEQQQEWLSKTKDAQAQLTSVIGIADELKSSLGKAEMVNQFLKTRQSLLASQLKDLPALKEFTRLHKQAYYYKAQVEEYKVLLRDKKKLERKALALLTKTKAFQSFMRKNSQLASLFRLPGTDGEGSISLAGLQTRVEVNALLQERFGSDPAAVAQLRSNVQAAQGQLNSLKNKVEGLTNGSIGNTGNELQQPNFKPKSQKTKSFFKRLEVGTNIQTQKARWMFPVTTDLGLSIGFKLNDKSILGIGGSYKLGLGTGWQHVAISHQGVGLRSYGEYQVKGSFFLSGGYEQNYRSEFKMIEQLKDRSAWQQSGLLGLTKKYNVGKKLKGNMQLLWDFLSYRQVPQSQAVLFRIGYNLK